MVGNNVVSYGCKKRLLDALRERLVRLDEAERKLIAREELDSSLQKLYDTLSVDGLKEKVKIMGGELQATIDAGGLTAGERPEVLEQLSEKLSALEAELTKAETDGKPKMKAKLEEAKEKLQATKAAVSDAKPAAIAALKYEDEIQRLHRKLGALARLEKESSGKYTLDELKRLGERSEMEEAMSVMKTRSRMWFESDEEFTARLQNCLSKAAAAPKKKASGGYPAASNSSNDGFKTVKKR